MVLRKTVGGSELTFRRPQRRSSSESSEEYPSGSPVFLCVSGLFGYVTYVIGALLLVSILLPITCCAWLVYCCQ